MTTWERYGSVEIGGEKKVYRRGRTRAEYTPWVKHFGSAQAEKVQADFLSDYLNNPMVRKALHIPDEVQAWEQCSGKVDYHYQNEASQWIYPIMK